jgi:para-nitrobenzyl esterase
MIGNRYDDADERLSDLLQRYWTNFARTGDPNGAGLPVWPRFGTTQSFLEVLPDAATAARPAFRKAQCDAFRDVVEAEPIYRQRP